MRASRLQLQNDHEARRLAHVVGLRLVGEPKDGNPFANDGAAAVSRKCLRILGDNSLTKII